MRLPANARIALLLAAAVLILAAAYQGLVNWDNPAKHAGHWHTNLFPAGT